MNTIAIPLWKGGRVIGHAKVNAEFTWLRQWRWRKSIGGYAMRAVSAAKHGRVIDNIWMHRVVIGCYSHFEVDHINRDRLDNRVENLRMVTRAENMLNKKRYANNKSGTTGVWFDKKIGRYIAYVCKDGKQVFLGRHETHEEAAMVAADARRERGFLLEPTQAGNG